MKLFVSVGTQLPFPRLLHAIESIESDQYTEIVYQSADADFNSNKGVVFESLTPKQYEQYFNECDIFISHAGMGSIITALDNNKPIIILPRMYKYNEHRNDHQITTAERFKSFENIYYSEHENDIANLIKIASNHVANEITNIKVEKSLLDFLKVTFDN